MFEPLKQFVHMLDPRRTDHRGTLRRPIEGVACSAGKIIDLSMTGARLQCTKAWPCGDIRSLTLTALPLKLTAQASSVWSRKERWRRHIVGIGFDSLDDTQKATLAQILDRHVVRKPLKNVV